VVIISAVVAAGLVTALVISHPPKLRTENESLRQQLEQMPQLATENERLSNLLRKASNSWTPTNAQLNDLLSLRSTVGSLREQTNELGKLREENRQLRSLLSVAGAPSKSATMTEAEDSLPKAAWTFAGQADPASAFLSVIWAMSQGDVKTFQACVAPGGERLWGKTDDEIAERIKSLFEKVTAVKILDKQVISPDEVVLNVRVEGINDTTGFRLHRLGDDWKFVGFTGPPKTR